MILFLDIDGVLHSVGERIANYFCYLPRLESVLHDFPHVRIVICSDWRKQHRLAELQSLFSDELRMRIIGVTPDLRAVMDKLDATGSRHHEAHAWMAKSHFTGAWVALDDDPYNWIDGDPLVFCDDGFTEIEEDALRSALASNKKSSCG